MWNNRAIRVIILQSPGKRASWKFWLDPRFPRNSKLKWTLSDCLSIGVTLNFTFTKGKSLLIISCHTYLSTRKFTILFQAIFVLSWILFLIKMSRNSMLLINNPSKRGDVKTLARSSIFPSPQVNMELKLTASR